MPLSLGPLTLGENGEYFFPIEFIALPSPPPVFRGLRRALQMGFPRCWYCGSALVTDAACCPHCGGLRKDGRRDRDPPIR